MKLSMTRMTVALMLLIGMALSLMLFLAPLASAQVAPVPPQVAARSVVMMNADTGQVLYSLNPGRAQLAMASTTKMMTALLIMENCKDLNAHGHHQPARR